MSTIGKFFVVLNLALAALFVGVSASLIADSDSYRMQLDTVVAAKAALQIESDDTIKTLNSDLAQAQGEAQRLQLDKSNLSAEKTALTENLESERQQNADLRESLQSIEGKLGDLQGTNGQLASDLDGVRRQYETVREERDAALDARDAANSTANSATNSANLAEGRATDLTLQLARSTERAAVAEAKLATVVSLYKVDLASIGAQPQMEGTVLEVDVVDNVTYVVINLGKRDSVQPGYTYDVYNGATYKGKIYVHNVNESKSAATVELGGNAAVSAGDRVVTRL
jgi:cell shape-determining protein MreC